MPSVDISLHVSAWEPKLLRYFWRYSLYALSSLKLDLSRCASTALKLDFPGIPAYVTAELIRSRLAPLPGYLPKRIGTYWKR